MTPLNLERRRKVLCLIGVATHKTGMTIYRWFAFEMLRRKIGFKSIVRTSKFRIFLDWNVGERQYERNTRLMLVLQKNKRLLNYLILFHLILIFLLTSDLSDIATDFHVKDKTSFKFLGDWLIRFRLIIFLNY